MLEDVLSYEARLYTRECPVFVQGLSVDYTSRECSVQYDARLYTRECSVTGWSN